MAWNIGFTLPPLSTTSKSMTPLTRAMALAGYMPSLNVGGSAVAQPVTGSASLAGGAPLLSTQGALTILTQSLRRARGGRGYSASVQALGGAYPYQFSGSSTYCSMNSDGYIFGFIPTGVTSDTMAGNVIDATGKSASFSFVISVDSATGALDVSALNGTSYTATQNGMFHLDMRNLIAGGSGRYAVSLGTVTGASTFYCTPSLTWLQSTLLGTVGTNTVNLNITDDYGATATASITVTVNTALSMWGFDAGTNTASLPNASVNSKYFHQFYGSGGTNTSIVASLIAGSLPSGLTLSGMTLTGTCNAAPGTYSPQIRLTDSASNASATITYKFVVLPDFSTTRPAWNTGTGFYVLNGRLYDPNGKPFTMRGINVCHYDSSWGTYIKKTGANAARIFIGTLENSPTPASTNGFANTCINADIMPILCPSYFPNSNGKISNSSNLTFFGQLMNQWVSSANTAAFQSNINANGAINLGNEFTPTDPNWRDCYKAVSMTISAINSTTLTCSDATNSFSATACALGYIYIKGAGGVADQCVKITNTTGVGGSSGQWTFTLANAISGYTGGGQVWGGSIGIVRAGGYTCPIVIDANAAGQGEACIASYGTIVQNSDPQLNCIFSFHEYGSGSPVEGRITSITKGGTTTINYTQPDVFIGGSQGNPPFQFNTAYLNGIVGIPQLNGLSGYAQSVSGSAGNYQAILQINSSTFSGNFTAGYIYATGYYPDRGARFGSFAARGLCLIFGEFGPSYPPLANGDIPSATSMPAGSLMRNSEENLVGYLYWAMDDGSNSNNTSYPGDFAACGNGAGGATDKAQFVSPSYLTIEGGNTIPNPVHGLWANAQPASFYL